MPKQQKKKRKAKKQKKTRRQPQVSQEVTTESRSVIAITVFWMMSLLATLFAEFVAVGVRIFLRYESGSELLSVLSKTMFFVALVAGVVTLIATFATIRIRETQPPKGIVVIAVVAGVAPILLLIAGAVIGS